MKQVVEPGQLRLITRVARMYHEQKLRQPSIAEQLSLSQSRVSRLLKQASELGIVRTVVSLPSGVYTDLEDEVQQRYDLRDVAVVGVEGTVLDVTNALGAATADYLDATLKGGDTIGISSWSSTLISAVSAMRPKSEPVADYVIQIMGGLGDPTVQSQATRLTGDLANLTGAEPSYMPTPGVLGSAELREALVADRAVAAVMDRWKDITVSLAGIGSLAPSPLLAQSGNALAPEDQDELRDAGAVGDVCLRFFDAEGTHVSSSFDRRVVGANPDQLKGIGRRIGVAGGREKFEAIRAALTGQWVNILITDVETARHLVSQDG